MASTVRNPERNDWTGKTENRERPDGAKSGAKRRLSLGWLVVLAVLFFGFSLFQLQLDYGRLFTGAAKFTKTVGLMFPPDASQWQYVLAAAVESIQVAILGTVLAIALAFFLSFLAAGNITPHPAVAWAVRSGSSLLRAIPTLIWALIFIVAVGMGPLPGVLAIMVGATGSLVKVFAQSLEEVDDGVIEALRSTGASWIQIVLQGVLPCALSALLAWCVMRFEGDLAESTILGAVGAGGIGYELSHAMRSYKFDQALFVGFVIFAMVFSVELASNRLKLRMRKRS
ncbi:phosphonate ABC transporter, permease protein PhnE [Paenibacillus sp. LHD-117]|uniref:phosphonate ABC transporter, permease protein PhnE n=1 Tax=Paenibacillus sp. LHD-117 TaxID=3071412 RepID=UPI0027E0BDF6|nr:phosphonate ABC transporter, permease protein PhnE [Paenibacillus sp. LHD-117]MDQ6420241.1 phosphonate ABC transporter, permease protein PhnE [Paenibacillus sp. LHD-117]